MMKLKNIENLPVTNLLIIFLIITVILSFGLSVDAQIPFRTFQQDFPSYNYTTFRYVLPANNDSVIEQNYLIDSTLYNNDSTINAKPTILEWSKKHFFETSFLTFGNQECNITFNPLFIFGVRKMKGDDTSSNNYTRNTRGFEAFGNLGRRITYYTSFYENQGYFFDYEQDYILKTGVIPGQGVGKEFKITQLDWAWVTGKVGIKATNNLYFVLGHGKNFIGSGYRSIILSDQAFNYPYLRTQIKFGKNFYYNILWSQVQSCGYGFDYIFENHRFRYTSYHVLGYNPQLFKGFNFSLIEGVVWRNFKSNGAYTTLPQAIMFLPVVSLPTIVNGFDGKDNTFLAADLRISPVDFLNIYGQIRFDGDDNIDNNIGYQVGFQLFNLFGLWRNNFPIKWNIQAEINSNNLTDIDPYTDRGIFGHYAEPLQFSMKKEKLLVTDITLYRRFQLSLMYSDNDVRTFKDLKISLIANPTMQWSFYGGAYKRNSDCIFYFGTTICPEHRYDHEL